MKGAIGEACVYSKLECCDTASSLSVCDTGMKNCFVDSPGARRPGLRILTRTLVP